MPVWLELTIRVVAAVEAIPLAEQRYEVYLKEREAEEGQP